VGGLVILALWWSAVHCAAPAQTQDPQDPWDPNYVVSEETAQAIEAALPDEPFVQPARPRRLLIYGRRPTHPMSVACCFHALEALGRRTGAFEAIASGDPRVFQPENLKQFDAVLLNNTHEPHPLLPFDQLDAKQQVASSRRETLLEQSLLEFVASGKGLAGIHAATATSSKVWLELLGGSFGGHITEEVWIQPNEPAHPLCAPLNHRSFQLKDEIYVSRAPDFHHGLRVLLSLDLDRMPDPGLRDDGDYAISWVRPYGRGRVFYCSLGHEASSYSHPEVLRHYLAGIQFVLGDLQADATPPIQRPNGYITRVPAEAPEAREARHLRIAKRRSGPIVMVHRGAWALFPENTLEAYAAAMDFGADGCEIDLRRTRDGVLVLFHDDGLDRMTNALGPVREYTYEELLAIPFRSQVDPGARIPTFAAVLELARRRGMLLHLDVKEPGLEPDIARLLDAADAWDHVVEINPGNAAELRQNEKAHCMAYKAFGWQSGRMDLDPELVRDGLALPGELLMVDDPRVAARALKRKVGRVPLPENLRAPLPPPGAAGASPHPGGSEVAHLRAVADRVDGRSFAELADLLAAEFSSTDLDGDAAHQQERAGRILERAWTAQQIGLLGDRSPRAVKLLEELVANRSLHRDWAYHGLDGAQAVRALGRLGAAESAPFLIKTFQTIDPELRRFVEPPSEFPYAWADHRMKREIIDVLGELPGEAGRQFLNEYLAMDEAEASRFSMPLFEEAARALLRRDESEETLDILLRSANPAVRGAAILSGLDRSAGRAATLSSLLPWTRELPGAFADTSEDE